MAAMINLSWHFFIYPSNPFIATFMQFLMQVGPNPPYFLVHFLILWFMFQSSSLAHCRKGPDYLLGEITQVFILFNFLLLSLVSSSFFLLLRYYFFLFFLLYLFLLDAIHFNYSQVFVVFLFLLIITNILSKCIWIENSKNDDQEGTNKYSTQSFFLFFLYSSCQLEWCVFGYFSLFSYLKLFFDFIKIPFFSEINMATHLIIKEKMYYLLISFTVTEIGLQLLFIG